MRRTPATAHGLLVVLALAAAPWDAAAQARRNEVFLWQLAPFDRVELTNNDSIDVEPVRIPPGVKFEVGDDEYVGRPGLPPVRDLKRQARYRIRNLGDDEEFYVRGRSIKKISLYEDMLMDEARRLVREGRFESAHQSLAAVANRSPNWPGLLDLCVEDRLREGESQAVAGAHEKAFWAMVEEKRLRERRVKETGSGGDDASVLPVRERIESLALRWFDALAGEGRHADVRRAVRRLESVYPDSRAAAERRAEITRKVARNVALAAEAESAGDLRAAYAAARAAVDGDPDDPDARRRYARVFKKYQVLRVAVERLSIFRHGLAAWTNADWRDSELLHVPLMRLAKLEPDGGTFDSQVIRSFAKSNVNKRATAELFPDLFWPGDGKPVTIVDLQRLLAESSRPESPLFHPAFARLVTNIEARWPNQLTIDFDRPQFQPAAWLQIPFLRVGYDPGVADSIVDSRFAVSGLGPYRLVERSADEIVFAKNPRFLEKNKPIVAQILERRVPKAADRLRALEEGEADLVADVPPRLNDKVGSMKDVRLVEESLPRIHVLQFNLNRRELRNRTLRRAIDFAINRPMIFEAVKIPQDEKNRIVTGPLPFGSLGYNAEVAPRAFDPQLARMLVYGVRKETGTVGSLRIRHAGSETSRQACDLVAKSLSAIGLPTSVVEAESDVASNPLDADLRYESYVVSDPIYDVVTLLTRNNPSLARHGSPWFRQKLIELVDVPNLSTAAKLLPELHRILHEDVEILPLWQWTERFAIRAGVGGTPPAPPSLYHRVVDWTVEPSYPPSHWARTK